MPETALGLSAFRDALREAYGDKYYPDTKLTEDEIRSELGMDDSLYEEVYAENTAQKAHPDTFIAVKVKEGKTDEVKEKLAGAFEKQLDSLFDDDALDIAADISVMESILKQEGLSGEDMKMPGLDPNDTSKTQTK